MKSYQYSIFIYISFIFYSCSISAGEHSNQLESENSAIQEPKVIATFESVNKWKATLFSQPFKEKVKRADGVDVEYVHTLCYVGISPTDSNEIYPVWQCVFGNIPGLGNVLPEKFVFGIADGNKFTLSFKSRIPTMSLCFFILEPNNKINLYSEFSDASNDKLSIGKRIASQDPNIVIPLSKVIELTQLNNVAPVSVTINSVCSYDNTTIFDLSGANRNFILRYSLVNGEPNYSVYKINDNQKD